MRRTVAAIATVLAAATLSSCAATSPAEQSTSSGAPLVVTTSAIAADFASRIGGNAIDVRLLVPNGFDSHTYEPRPSELAMLGDADLIVLPAATLNAAITGLVELSGDTDRILDLNAAGLTVDDLVYREPGNAASANPHTWTSPKLAAKWLTPLSERITQLDGVNAPEVETNLAALRSELDALDADIRTALTRLTPQQRKLVVYHDAWQYFGREYDIPVIGAIQAASFAEPSAAELAAMVEQIRSERVPAFFGSEVFPSDVLHALEAETGSTYIPDLADDRLPGNPGDTDHTYTAMMRNNVELILRGLSS
jgi:ABC-type Zn uptake system ZnuABC Zn-binding protein ZnuA